MFRILSCCRIITPQQQRMSIPLFNYSLRLLRCMISSSYRSRPAIPTQSTSRPAFLAPRMWLSRSDMTLFGISRHCNWWDVGEVGGSCNRFSVFPKFPYSVDRTELKKENESYSKAKMKAHV